MSASASAATSDANVKSETESAVDVKVKVERSWHPPEGKGVRKRQELHKFTLGNPCGVCEWHIQDDVRFFVWFDLVFQAIFVIPVILEFRYYWQIYSHKDPKKSVAAPPATSRQDCDVDKLEMAVIYFICDIVNLGLGMISDITVYIGTLQRNKSYAMTTCIIFLVIGLLREILHVGGVTLHMMRCAPATFAYEIIVRVLCQYLIWGLWMVFEYFNWLRKGRRFIPEKNKKEPPILELKFFEIDATKSTSAASTITPSWNQMESNELMTSPNSGVKIPPVLKKNEAGGSGSGSPAVVSKTGSETAPTEQLFPPPQQIPPPPTQLPPPPTQLPPPPTATAGPSPIVRTKSVRDIQKKK